MEKKFFCFCSVVDLSHMQEKPMKFFQAIFYDYSVEWMVLDEGDKLFEQGDAGFRDQVATIFQACDNPRVRHVLFSATLANNVEEWSKLHLDNVVRINIGTRYLYLLFFNFLID